MPRSPATTVSAVKRQEPAERRPKVLDERIGDDAPLDVNGPLPSAFGYGQIFLFMDSPSQSRGLNTVFSGRVLGLRIAIRWILICRPIAVRSDCLPWNIQPVGLRCALE